MDPVDVEEARVQQEIDRLMDEEQTGDGGKGIELQPIQVDGEGCCLQEIPVFQTDLNVDLKDAANGCQNVEITGQNSPA